ncbi:MAG: hypothetical protein ACHQUC_05040 [Chlamydiales bacterium]
MSEAELSKYFMSKKVPYVKPFFTLNLSKENEVLDWFREAHSGLSEYYRPLFREQKENISFFLGSGINPNFASPYMATFATTSDIYAEPQQIFINEMYRLTLDQVSLIVSHELIPDVLPNSEDYSDKVACNVVKDWLEAMNYVLKTEEWRFRWEIQKKMYGEAFCVVMWNPMIGDIHPMAQKYIDDDLDLVDEEGKQISNIGNIPMKIRKNMRIGDIEFVNPMPWDVMIDPQLNYKDANWFYWVEYVDVDYLKKKYPKYTWDTTSQSDKAFDPFTNTEKDNPDRRTIYYFYHRSHEFLPEGRFIIASKEHVLVNEPIKMRTIINNQDLPLVRFCDLDLGVGNRGVPILFRNCKNLSDAYSRVSNQIYNNLEMSSPKIFVHESSGVDAQRMPNGTVAFEWHGNHKPSIETPQCNTGDIFKFRESLKKDMDEIALQTPMVRGDTPNAQLDSFVSLQYFEDLRNQLASSDIKGHIRSMEHLYRLMITIAKDKYRPDDGRLIKILGKHNTYQLKYFDPINLQKSYDVHISTTGNLANSKAARSQMLISIKREFPDILGDEVFLDMLGLSHSKKFMNAITAAVSSAEAENQDMMGGQEVLAPTRFEDLLAHWETHRIPMQTMDFKQSPEEVQDGFIGHVAATEKLMFEQAAENPSFATRLENLRQFPMFYTPKPVNEPPPMPLGMEGELGAGLPPIPEEPIPEMNQQQAI